MDTLTNCHLALSIHWTCSFGNKEGVLRDYIDYYRINEKYLAFGHPTKYVELEADGRELPEYDDPISKAVRDYKQLPYNFKNNYMNNLNHNCGSLNQMELKMKFNHLYSHNINEANQNLFIYIKFV